MDVRLGTESVECSIVCIAGRVVAFGLSKDRQEFHNSGFSTESPY